MSGDYMLDIVLGKIKKIIGIENFYNTFDWHRWLIATWYYF